MSPIVRRQSPLYTALGLKEIGDSLGYPETLRAGSLSHNGPQQMSESYEHITVERRGDVAILKIITKRIAEYDVAGALRDELIAAYDSQGVSQAIVDLAELEVMSSVGYGPFVSMRLHVTNNQGRVVLCNLSDFISEVFTTARPVDQSQLHRLTIRIRRHGRRRVANAVRLTVPSSAATWYRF